MKRVAWTVGLAILASAAPVASQVQIADDVACRQCSIRLQVVTTLQGDRVAGEPRSIARTSRGHYLVTFWPAGEEVLEFDSGGRFLRVFAGNGQGPGEVSGVGHLEISGVDTVRVYDRGRIQTFTANGQFVRAQPCPIFSIHDAVSLGPNRAIVNTGAYGRDGRGAPLHVVQGSNLIRSFGVVDPAAGPNTPHLMVRSLTSDGGRRLWSAELTRYEIREWNLNGEPTGFWTRAVPWFRPWNQLVSITPDSRPDPRLGDIEWIGHDRLLLLLRIPGEDWRAHLGPPQHRPGRQPAYPDAALHKVFRSRLEVIDLSEGRVILQADEPRSAGLIIDDRYLAGYTENETGEPAIIIWQYAIDEPRADRM